MRAGSVLLVDDEEDVRLAVGQSLELEGFDVTAFARAERALDRKRGHVCARAGGGQGR